MEPTHISTLPRETGGKGPARRLRREGRTPAVVYGHQLEAAVAVSLDPRELDTALANPKGANAVFDVAVGDATHRCLVREIQRHAVGRQIMHVDLVVTDLTRPLVASVPVRHVGRSIGVQMGGVVNQPYREVKVRALPEAVPAEIVIDITEFDHDDGVMASELALPEGVAPVFERDYVVVKIVKPRGRLAEEEEGEESGEAAAEESAADE